MKKNIIRALAGICLLGLIASCIVPQMTTKAQSVSDLGQLWDDYEEKTGTSYTLSTNSRFYIVAESAPTGGTRSVLDTVKLVSQQFAADKMPSAATLPIVWGPEEWAVSGDIVIKLDKNSGIGEDGYTLNVADKAVVTASDTDGLLYGLNMLQKCFRAYGTNLSGFTAADTPDTKERTVMLDCGRKYYTKDWICNFIREMSWMGYNAIELHFSEDGGFRADFWDPEYYTENYKPKNDFTWLCGSKMQTWVKGDKYTTDPNPDKWLETQELIDILNTAKEYHMEVIPSFDSPAHMDYITWKFEQHYKDRLGEYFIYDMDRNGLNEAYYVSASSGRIHYLTGKTLQSVPEWPYYTTIDITNVVAKGFVFALYEDIADFFKEYAGSTKFNIGADEVNIYSNHETYGTSWQYDKFDGYVNDLNRMLNAKDYTCRMFNDFIGLRKYNGNASAPTRTFDSNIEIVYWNSAFKSFNDEEESKDVWSAEEFWGNTKGGNRTVYNAIQTNCYYVLRAVPSNNKYGYADMDARNPNNYRWEFTGSTEDIIYNNWTPANPKEYNKYAQQTGVNNIPDEKLGGAYFIIWSDYAALDTEQNIWNGSKDVKDNATVYSLRNRMWSNSIKMLNSDINNTVTFAKYETLRNNFGDFPGYGKATNSCSTPVTFSAAQTLTAAVDPNPAPPETEKPGTEQPGTENPGTENPGTENPGTENPNPEQPGTETTEKTITVYCKAEVNGELKPIYEVSKKSSGSQCTIYLPPIIGYKYKSISGATYEALPAGDGSGYVRVSEISGIQQEVVVMYENAPSTARLDDVLKKAPKAQEDESFYTPESWAVYSEALKEAEGFEVKEGTIQQHVDAVVAKLEAAITQLTAPLEGSGYAESTIISEEVISPTAKVGKKIGLLITTTADVKELTITKDGAVQELAECTARVQKLANGEVVKIWLVNITAVEADKGNTITFSITGTVSETGATVSLETREIKIY